MSALTLELVAGKSRDFDLVATNPDGTPATSFLGTDALSATVWAGGGQAAAVSPAATWTNASTGSFRVSFANSDTASLSPATYTLEVTATRGGRSAVIVRCQFKVLADPGNAPAPAVYCRYEDMLVWCPWVGDLKIAEADTAGFLTQRRLARTWLEGVIQRHYRQNNGVGLATWGNVVPTWGPQRTGADSKYLQDQLDANYLMVKPRVIELTAKYAIAVVLQAQRAGSDKANYYLTRAGQFYAEADSLVAGYSAEIDTNGDGYPEIVVECGSTDVLQG